MDIGPSMPPSIFPLSTYYRVLIMFYFATVYGMILDLFYPASSLFPRAQET